MRKSITTAAIILMTAIGAPLQANTANPSTIVIVHGAWSSAKDFKDVEASLKKSGNEVIVVNLPGHGDDQTHVSSLTLQGYVDTVKKAIGTRKNVTLVGHSFGGMVVSETAEQIPGQIKKLIYLCAFLPNNGESLFSISAADKETHIGQYIQPDEKAGVVGIAKNGILDFFAADAPSNTAERLVANFKPEPLGPLATPVVLTSANFGKINKVYIFTEFDHAIGLTLQKSMAKGANVTRTYSLPTSHTPFFSQPAVVASILNEEAK
ncbi:alpha/beta fold hydrolase [Flavobacterium tyrosinilyticum]|uniref:alpha/beta fold hydrolase n=1 Tax=Flavobacterium tyrosinilyticum TaxID=1658740 RepID=UPI00202EE6D7|nr:alpha/beta hydrolase [Flavobacterium tyrosinilyticum]MCM0667634.1 alpha/beta hydrolase [Flavobacterium tyrosinilyticum]